MVGVTCEVLIRHSLGIQMGLEKCQRIAQASPRLWLGQRLLEFLGLVRFQHLQPTSWLTCCLEGWEVSQAAHPSRNACIDPGVGFACQHTPWQG